MKPTTAARKNPATATGAAGVFFTAVGHMLGWAPETQLNVTTAFLVAVPAVRGAVWWYEHRNDPDPG